MKIPTSMKNELQEWNNGDGIDLESWISCTGNFSLAVGYASIFTPEFVEFEDYLIRADDVNDELIASIRAWEKHDGITAKSLEYVMNHIHIADLQHADCDDISSDKLLLIGGALKQIYEAMLAVKFPNKPCTVEFYVPSDTDDLEEYQVSFWQNKHDV